MTEAQRLLMGARDQLVLATTSLRTSLAEVENQAASYTARIDVNEAKIAEITAALEQLG